MENTGLDLTHIRHCLIFLFDKGFNAKQATNEVHSIYGNGSTNYTTVKEWFSRFREGNRSVNDRPRSGRPTVIDDEVLKNAIEQNGKMTIEQLADQFDVSFGTIQGHLRKLGKVG
jgi:histone-lysine N-methyltransferase SETMAR